MQRWIIRTPEFRLAIVLISSPLTMLVALWGMTNGRVLRAMRSKKKAMDLMRGSMLRGEA